MLQENFVMKPVAVLIAVADAGVRAHCRSLINAEPQAWVVGEVEEADKLIETVQRTGPRIVLLGGSFGGVRLAALIRLLCSRHSDARILSLMDGADKELVLDALSAGARGYLRHSDLAIFLGKAIVKVDQGEAWVPRRMVGPLLDRLRRLSDTAALPSTKVQ